MGQVYGDVLYYATSLLDIEYCRPERYYFWFYYFFFNFIWMVVGCCMDTSPIIDSSTNERITDYAWQGVTKIFQALKKLESLERLQKQK